MAKIFIYLKPLLSWLFQESQEEKSLAVLKNKLEPWLTKKSLLLNQSVSSQEKAPGVLVRVDVEEKFEICDKSIEEIRKELEKFSFQLTEEVRLKDYYLDFGEVLRQRDEAIRVRFKGDNRGGELKWEGSRGKGQDRPFLEVSLPDQQTTQKILDTLKNELDFTEYISFDKYRFEYKAQIDELICKIELDEFPQDNPKNLAGKKYLQIAFEEPEEKRNLALASLEKTAVALKLGDKEPDNRDYYEIAIGRQRRNL